MFALYLAARRQRTQELELEARRDELINRQVELNQRERTQAHAEQVAEASRLHSEQVAADDRHDAAERRLTDIYTKAAEQFGSNNVAVQLAGLYGFERLANDHPQLRQTVVNVICSFLRMPPPSITETTVSINQNIQVRSAAQRILLEHLHPPEELSDDHSVGIYWEVSINLSKATLEDFSLTKCRINKGTFVEAVFTGGCNFAGLIATGELDLTSATFGCPMTADEMHISGDVTLDSAVFETTANFNESRFEGRTILRGTEFLAEASFDRCHFFGSFHCLNSTWSDSADFTGSTFHQSVDFDSTTFEGEASFRGADFLGDTRFSLNDFLSEARFNNTDFSSSTPLFSGVAFRGDAWFHGISLRNGILFEDVPFEGAADLGDCDNAGASDVRAKINPLYRQWPPNWTEGPKEEAEWNKLADDAGLRHLRFTDMLWNFAQD